MLVHAPASPGSSGVNGVSVAAQAEKLIAMLWEQVLSGMTATALPSSALGTGSNVYDGIALHAVASSVFSQTDGGLRHDIVAQLTEANPSAGQNSRPLDSLSLAGSSLEALRTLANVKGSPGIQGSAMVKASTILDRAIAFAQKVWPDLQQAALKLDVPPVGLLAQTALETGWGSAIPGNNLFGIKAVNGQASVSLPTKEMVEGSLIPATASFATYPSISSAVGHLTSLLETRFRDVLGASSVEQFAAGLARGGYATDDAYAQKIIDIARSPIMDQVLQSLGISS